MADEKKCPKCGLELPLNAPRGVCPQCLLVLGLPTGKGESQTVRDSSGPVETTQGPVFVPPEPAELAEQFPQLEIIELLGAGGMGAVYKARQKQLDRLVALKILPPQVAGDPAFAERFSREARSMARLNHPNIVTLYEFGRTENGIYYLLMEFIDGTDLRRVIQAATLTPEKALHIVPRICEALEYAHSREIVHRDIKPENVLLAKDGTVKIADFGLARLLGRPAGDFTLTQTQQRMGTPHYMAPEQIDGAHKVDHRADIFSLGVVFYEMLTGQLPLGRFAPPSTRVHIDVRLDSVVLKTLENEPERRYQHVSEVKTDVEAILSNQPQPNRSARNVTYASGHSEARFSRAAIVGACWSALAMFWLPVAAIYMAEIHPSDDEEITAAICGLIACTPIFGTTILGIIAVTGIRNSAGRLYGLGLATFDMLLFPLLLLDTVIFIVTASNITQGTLPRPYGPIVMFAGIIAIPILDILIAHWVWRKVSTPAT